MYAVRDRIDLSHYEDSTALSKVTMADIDFNQFFPSTADSATLINNFTTMVARVLVKRVPSRVLLAVWIDTLNTTLTKKWAISLKW